MVVEEPGIFKASAGSDRGGEKNPTGVGRACRLRGWVLGLVAGAAEGVMVGWGFEVSGISLGGVCNSGLGWRLGKRI